MSLWRELRRRNVVRIAVAYLAAVWLLLQVASLVLPTFQAPEWIMQSLIVAAALGFPLAIVLAWQFEITPQGISASDQVPEASPVAFTGRKLDFVVIAMLVLAVAGLWVDRGAEGERRLITSNSVAVLPFSNLSPESDNAFYAAGLHDAILNQLAKLSQLSVISRVTMLRYAGSELSIPEIAEELNVETVLQGTVRYDGDRIRIGMQLIDAATEQLVWSEIYDREFEDIFVIESDIAMNVANALDAEFSVTEQQALETPATASIDAYRNYLKSSNTRNLEAREYANLAIAADPEFTDAYVSRAWAGAMSFLDADRPAARVSEEQQLQIAESVFEDVERVLELENTPRQAVYAHMARALVHISYWRYSAASAALDDGIAENATDGYSLGTIAALLAAIGRSTDAISIGERATELDPGNHWGHTALGMAYLWDSRPAAAAEVLREAAKLAPQEWNVISQLVFAEVANGEYDRARQYLDDVVRLGQTSTIAAMVSYIYSRMGDTAKAEEYALRVEEFAEEGPVSSFDWALVNLARSDREQALAWMQRTVEEIEAGRPSAASMNIIGIKSNPYSDPVLDEPEFAALRERMRGR